MLFWDLYYPTIDFTYSPIYIHYKKPAFNTIPVTIGIILNFVLSFSKYIINVKNRHNLTDA